MRYHDWSARLAEVVENASRKKFSYGTFDCALFAADCVYAMTGVDYAETMRGYQSKKDAYQIVAQYGSLQQMINSLLQQQPIEMHYAQPGDVVLANAPLGLDEEGDVVGICLGVRFAAPRMRGLQHQSMSLCKLAWRIS